ncbi:MAG: hypothetical protein ACRDHP_18235, partial [Ktedonobacterales bacterium]
PYTLFIRPEIGPITPMELDYRAIYRAAKSSDRRAEVDAIAQQIAQRFNTAPPGVATVPSGQPPHLYPERSREGILAVLSFLSPDNRADGIVLSVPGRIPYTIGSDQGLDTEIGTWFKHKTDELTTKYQDDLVLSAREIETLKRDHALRVKTLKERYEAMLHTPTPPVYTAPPPPPVRMPTPPLAPLPPGPGQPAPEATGALNRKIGELEVERDHKVAELEEFSNSIRELRMQLSRVNLKANKLTTENQRLREHIDDLRAALAARHQSGSQSGSTEAEESDTML